VRQSLGVQVKHSVNRELQKLQAPLYTKKPTSHVLQINGLHVVQSVNLELQT